MASTLLLIVASLATAQQPTVSPPLAPPLAPAALAIPHPLDALKPGARDLYQSPDRSDRFQRLATHPVPPVIVPGVYMPGAYYPYYPAPYYPSAAQEYHPPIPRAARGGLALEMLPDESQVYVDGFYVGLAQEFGLRGRPLDLAAGAHRVELRAPGYDMLSFSVMIAPSETLRYRGDMQRLPSAPTPRAAQQPAANKSFYIIPNCYAGDRPPTGALPRGCDLKNLQTRTE